MAENTLEEIVFGVVNIFESKMPAKLDALDTEYNDTLGPLEDIARYFVGDLDESLNVQEAPFVVVMGRGYSVDSSSLATGRDMLRVELECYARSDPNIKLTKESKTFTFEEVLEVKIMRYARAMREVLYENRTLGARCEFINVEDALISNVMRVEHAFLRACRLNCLVSTFKR
ncbi:MAG: hypothetical protein COV75_05105 [Candidatus Omnitrophica bacterium CG11_big_fil_rev_8_21_14_0_20_63_9]|nr:MAG: hypothetical protein COV75_05105 [Candidatus Omnitrophica bacterium CG11_big_fil_rev_8_21_14_0_20_63_9]